MNDIHFFNSPFEAKTKRSMSTKRSQIFLHSVFYELLLALK